MAGKRKPVDKQRLHTLALIGASTELMARTLSVSRDTLERRFRAQIEEARSEGETQILGKIFTAAMRGTRWALELSAINRLGWSNRPETVVNVTQNSGPLLDRRSPEEIKTQLFKMHQALKAEIAKEDNGDGELPDRFNGLEG